MRQHDVEQQQIRREAFHRRERILPGVAGFDQKAFVLQVVAQQPRDRPVVLDDQNSLGHSAYPVPGRPVLKRSAAGR
jgi:hypothetical protein